MNKDITNLVDNIEKVIIGKRAEILKIIAAMLCGGHVLIEDVPGVGKTKLVSTLARSVNGKFNRIQLTPDVMPSDITGFTMIDPQTKKFEYRPGAAACNFLLADEINRASPKVQSGLLEIMDERKISMDSRTYALPKPFMVLATQNPVETYGTYHLPEAQIDRFLIKISLGYMQPSEELKLLDSTYQTNLEIQPTLTTEQVNHLQEEVSTVFSHAKIRGYMMQVIGSTRTDDNVKLGISPRGTIGWNAMAKAMAFVMDRNYVVPDDAVAVASNVLAHRIILSPKGLGTFKTQEAFVNHLICNTPLPGMSENYQSAS